MSARSVHWPHLRSAGSLQRVLQCSMRLFALLLLFAAVTVSALEHPTLIPRERDCASCHVDKTTGKSVHSALEMSCTVCHFVKTQGDMTTVSLAMSKEEICFACHQRSAFMPHMPPAKRACLDCHEAHSSARPMLLKKGVSMRDLQMRTHTSNTHSNF
jgi:predicted CXXCH cytochrome family protein